MVSNSEVLDERGKETGWRGRCPKRLFLLSGKPGDRSRDGIGPTESEGWGPPFWGVGKREKR